MWGGVTRIVAVLGSWLVYMYMCVQNVCEVPTKVEKTSCRKHKEYVTYQVHVSCWTRSRDNPVTFKNRKARDRPRLD